MSRNTALSLSSDGSMEGAGELVTALAKLDKEWTLANDNRRGRQQGWDWQKLVVKETASTSSSADDVPPPLGTTEEFVYLLEPPPSTTPSCIILFTGGAGLGQYPHIAYGEFLKRIAYRLNAAIVAAPYQIGLDHFEIAKKTGELLRMAVISLEDERSYADSTPKFAIAHSLGAKLQTISLAATGIGEDLQGIGFMSFNNFGFSSIVKQTRSFATDIQSGMSGAAGSNASAQQMQNDAMMDTLFGFAEMAIGSVGLEFSPSPSDTERLISLKYDTELQKKTRLFVFDDDDLDSSLDFLDSCQGFGPSASGLSGGHLSPVFIKLGLENLDIPEEARGIADQVAGGFQSASFGDEDILNQAVSEVCSWVLGNNPARGPDSGSAGEKAWGGQRRLFGQAVDAHEDE